MFVTPYMVWRITAVANVLAWLFLGRFWIPLTSALCAHLGVFIWGIFDLRLQFFVRVFRCGSPQSRMVAISFDDGPDPDITGAILDVLRQHRMTATFFVVGHRARMHPELLRRADREGHVIACHDLTHRHTLNFRLANRMVREIEESRAIVSSIIGRIPRLYRPPNGLTNPDSLKALARLRMECVGWSRSVHDAGNVRRRVLARIPALAAPGQIILLHDILPVPENRSLLLRQIDALCVSITSRGLRAVGVDELLGLPAYEPGLTCERAEHATP
jgi:peptidoglycan/xylan/chitin deacetylase (PgdA/CDA1 family)